MAIDKYEIKNTEVAIANKSFDSEFEIPFSESLGFDGKNLQRLQADALASVITIDDAITYIAIAAPGTLQSEAKWQVRKVDETDANNVITTWCDGNSNFDNVATDLTSLTYS